MGHAILHLLDDKETVIAKVYDMLNLGRYFVSSTACMNTRWSPLRVGLILSENPGLFPTVRYFSIEGLVQSLTDIGFAIDHQWAPENSDAVFIVVKKAGVKLAYDVPLLDTVKLAICSRCRGYGATTQTIRIRMGSFRPL
ncbi:MAG: hypothetical protein ABGW81_06390 [Paracoccaceae bacterium]